MQVAILFDGSYFVKKFQAATRGVLPTAEEIEAICSKIMESDDLKDDQLFRVYFYDCYPTMNKLKNPISREDMDFGGSFPARKRLLDELKMKPRLALRSGVLVSRGWKIPLHKVAGVIEKARQHRCLAPSDIAPNLQQKEVDIKIGLDIAWLSSKRIVDKIVLFTGDGDFIPAMKFARKEGVLVYVAHFGYRLKDSLCEHSDGLVALEPPAPREPEEAAPVPAVSGPPVPTS